MKLSVGSRALVVLASVALAFTSVGCSSDDGDEDDVKFAGGGGASSGGSSSGGSSGGRFDYKSTPGVVKAKDGLWWQRDVNPNKQYTWQEAKDYCDLLELGGAKDWRLPHRDELCTIVDVKTSAPSIDTKAFPDTPPKPFWTATKYSLKGYAWGIDFNDASVDCGQGYAAHNKPHYVRCVR